MKTLLFTFAWLSIFILPSHLQSATNAPSQFESREITDIEIDVSEGYLYFKAGSQNLCWYLTEETLERLEAAILVGAQLQKCKSIEVTWSREDTRKRNGVVYDCISSMVIRLK